MAEVFETDVVVIGAGPVGLFAVFQSGMLGMRCHVVDALDVVGGQCSALYPEKPIYDVPGFAAIEAQALIDNLAEQARPFAPHFHLGQQVTGLAQEADGIIRVTTSAGTAIACRSVLVAAGCGAFGPNRPPLDGIEQYEGSSVFYLVTRREAFRGQKIVIAGGGDSAVDWAISLSEVAAKVMLVHRRAKFRAAPESTSRLDRLAKEGRVELVVPYQLHGLEGSDGALTGVVVADLDGATRLLEADVLLPFFGLSTDLGPLADWGFKLERQQIAVDPATCGTGIPGVFAIGDIATYPGKLKLILTGFADAAHACHAAYSLVNPGQALHFEHSTTRGIPAA